MKFTILLTALAAPSMVFGNLDQMMKSNGRKYIGAATDPDTFNDSNVESILQSEFGSLTAENSMKWESIELSQGSYTFDDADQLVEFAISNQKSLRGHTLLWHSELPAWVHQITDEKTLTSVIKNHIKKLVGRYRGMIYAWDVVNEVFNEDGTFRNTVFYNVLGESFIDLAFREAHAADPEAKLYINDYYNLDSSGSKVDATIALVERLKRRGVPIHGVGIQAHLILGMIGDDVEEQLQRMGILGLDVAITELDIRILKDVTDEKLLQQQDDYKTVFTACMNVPKCVGITVWGVSDKNSWVDTTYPKYGSPLLFDGNFNRKPAYNGAYVALNSYSYEPHEPYDWTKALEWTKALLSSE